MAKVYEISRLAEEVKGIRGKVRRATARALIRTAVAASGKAKRNATNVFKGTKDRPKQGFLVNSIFAGVTYDGSRNDNSKVISEVSVAVRSQKGDRGTRPYGRILEFGGTITPKNAQNLWIPAFGPKSSGDLGLFRDMTPRQFMKAFLDKTGKRRVTITGKGKGKRAAFKSTRVAKPAGKFDDFSMIWRGSGLIAGITKRQGRGKSLKAKFIALFFLRQKVDMPARPYVTPAVEEEFPLMKARLDEELGN